MNPLRKLFSRLIVENAQLYNGLVANPEAAEMHTKGNLLWAYGFAIGVIIAVIRGLADIETWESLIVFSIPAVMIFYGILLGYKAGKKVGM
ncbi:MAG TPA: hypothetical protein VLH13_01095 [Methanomassiliicoccales archaeon]|nr:hypothetical protein [Methanomassiliicoccales archaeon]